MLAKETLAKGIKPELEVFEVGMVENLQQIFGERLASTSAPLSIRLRRSRRHARHSKISPSSLRDPPQGSTWSVIGIGPSQLPMAMMAIGDGRSCPGWLEDNIYYSRGSWQRTMLNWWREW